MFEVWILCVYSGLSGRSGLLVLGGMTEYEFLVVRCVIRFPQSFVVAVSLVICMQRTGCCLGVCFGVWLPCFRWLGCGVDGCVV